MELLEAQILCHRYKDLLRAVQHQCTLVTKKKFMSVPFETEPNIETLEQAYALIQQRRAQIRSIRERMIRHVHPTAGYFDINLAIAKLELDGDKDGQA